MHRHRFPGPQSWVVREPLIRCARTPCELESRAPIQREDAGRRGSSAARTASRLLPRTTLPGGRDVGCKGRHSMHHGTVRTVAALFGVFFAAKAAYATYSIVAVDQTMKEVGATSTSCVGWIGGTHLYDDYISAPGRGVMMAQAYTNLDLQVRDYAKQLMTDGNDYTAQQLIRNVVGSRAARRAATVAGRTVLRGFDEGRERFAPPAFRAVATRPAYGPRFVPQGGYLWNRSASRASWQASKGTSSATSACRKLSSLS
jgi:hypothetical protein